MPLIGVPDLTPYALLTGRADGQTLYGGNAANDDLILEPTSHATKTTAYVLLAPSGGNVGIGTTGPTDKLDIAGALKFTSSIGWDAAKTGRICYNSDGGLIIIGKTATSYDFILASAAGTNLFANPTGTNNLLLVQSTGNVGIGTTAPLGKLIVKGAGTTTGIGLQTQNSSGTALVTMLDSGNVGIGTSAPTSKLQVVGLPIYANNAAAVAGGLTAGAFYRTNADPDPVCVVH